MADEALIAQLVGAELSGVVFVKDYLQLQFDGLVLSALTRVRVESGEVTAAFGEARFANLLIGRIGKSVIQAEVRSGHSMDLRLSDGSSIAVSLRPEDYVGPEAINLWLRDGTLVVL
jgi:hypothetical protein